MTSRPSFTCPVCSATSHHPKDVANGYCGRCHRFTGPEERARQAGLLRDAARAHADSGDADPARWGVEDDVETVQTWDGRVLRQLSVRGSDAIANVVCGAHRVLYPEAEHIDLVCGRPPHPATLRHRDSITGHEWDDDD
ncbi:hypothetical protein [Streptomyces sp. cg35]|uniref:hypothetical protein n=1 Tax=Streptomyces sp. cg35 TaxID=3421650 RepID=UPI003D167293